MNKFIASIINELLDEELDKPTENINTDLVDKYLTLLEKIDP